MCHCHCWLTHHHTDYHMAVVLRKFVLRCIWHGSSLELKCCSLITQLSWCFLCIKWQIWNTGLHITSSLQPWFVLFQCYSVTLSLSLSCRSLSITLASFHGHQGLVQIWEESSRQQAWQDMTHDAFIFPTVSSQPLKMERWVLKSDNPNKNRSWQICQRPYIVHQRMFLFKFVW